MAGPSMKVEQRMDWSKTEGDAIHDPSKFKSTYRYVVLTTRNTVLHAIGESLTKEQVAEMISLGIEVVVV